MALADQSIQVNQVKQRKQITNGVLLWENAKMIVDGNSLGDLRSIEGVCDCQLKTNVSPTYQQEFFGYSSLL